MQEDWERHGLYTEMKFTDEKRKEIYTIIYDKNKKIKNLSL